MKKYSKKQLMGLAGVEFNTISIENVAEKAKVIRALISDDKKLLEGYNFVQKVSENFEDWQEYNEDSFTRELTDQFFQNLNKYLKKNHPKILEPENKGYSGRKSEGKFYQNTKDLSLKEIAKLVREEYKLRFTEMKFSVRTQYYSGGQSLNVEVSEIPFNPYSQEVIEELKKGKNFDEISKDPIRKMSFQQSYLYTDKYNKLKDELKEIADQYNYDDSDAMTDYFSVKYYNHVRINIDDWLEKINPNHPEVIRRKKFDEDWKKIDEAKKKKVVENKPKFYAFQPISYESYFRKINGGTEKATVDAIISKGASGTSRMGNSYNVKALYKDRTYRQEGISEYKISERIKPFYEFTLDEIINENLPFWKAQNYDKDTFLKYFGDKVKKSHRKAIKDAIEEGKNVPEKVLNLYKDLKRLANKNKVDKKPNTQLASAKAKAISIKLKLSAQ